MSPTPSERLVFEEAAARLEQDERVAKVIKGHNDSALGFFFRSSILEGLFTDQGMPPLDARSAASQVASERYWLPKDGSLFELPDLFELAGKLVKDGRQGVRSLDIC